MAKTSNKTIARQKRVRRIRKKVKGSAERPRLSVYKSCQHIYAQIIDDVSGTTLSSASSLNSEIEKEDLKGKADMAKRVGLLLATKAKEKGIERVVFDRGGNIYHGRIKALSDGAREGGLEF